MWTLMDRVPLPLPCGPRWISESGPGQLLLPYGLNLRVNSHILGPAIRGDSVVGRSLLPLSQFHGVRKSGSSPLPLRFWETQITY